MAKKINQNIIIAFAVIALKKLKISVTTDITKAKIIPEIINDSLKPKLNLKNF
ncbi:hypothetical protein [Methanoregula sp.]|jgi:hypothetical protein|uniref:hypothetical protein n=1 Tax=Methanoregula sp. TaxID=2052170 RepID=UPI00356571AA